MAAKTEESAPSVVAEGSGTALAPASRGGTAACSRGPSGPQACLFEVSRKQEFEGDKEKS